MNSNEREAWNYRHQKALYIRELNELLQDVKSAQLIRSGRTDIVVYKRNGWKAKFFKDDGNQVTWCAVSGYKDRLTTTLAAMKMLQSSI